jgi:hypothetical protein
MGELLRLRDTSASKKEGSMKTRFKLRNASAEVDFSGTQGALFALQAETVCGLGKTRALR